mgnify:CR=1 FL=1
MVAAVPAAAALLRNKQDLRSLAAVPTLQLMVTSPKMDIGLGARNTRIGITHPEMVTFFGPTSSHLPPRASAVLRKHRI